jgi:cyanophycinase-like exopeptidase
MNSKKNIYLMAGGRGARATDLVMKAIFKELAKPNPAIAYIGAASGDDRNFFGFIGEMIKRGGDCSLTQVMLTAKKADLNKAKDILSAADAVFMSGGDVEAGMQVLQDKQIDGYFKELYQSGKLFFGASAGSIMLADQWVRWTDPDDDNSAELFPCLGIAPVLCDTHSEGDHWEELQSAIKLNQPGMTGYGIATNSCLKVSPAGELEALGGPVARYSRQNEQVNALPDLLPIKINQKG